MKKPKDIKKITLYLKKCYGCDRHDKFAPLRNFVFSNQLPINVLNIKRIVYSVAWQKEASDLGVDLPSLVFEYKSGEKETMSYSSWLKCIETPKTNRKKRAVAKVKNDNKKADQEKE